MYFIDGINFHSHQGPFGYGEAIESARRLALAQDMGQPAWVAVWSEEDHATIAVTNGEEVYR